jgi:GntR family transcriptional regulator, carbon starvation induced regulator
MLPERFNWLMDSTSTLTQTTVTLTDQAYAALRMDILNGELKPGFKLRVEHLKSLYGTGASPIREALSRLTGDGLVHAEGRRGFRVGRVSRSELLDITEMRILLECHALRESIDQGDDAWEAGIMAAFYRLSKLDSRLLLASPGEEWEVRHKEFHTALVSACDSRWLQYHRQNLFDQSERYRRIALSMKNSDRPVPEEHKAIMTATLARDSETACALMSEHFRKTAEAVSRSALIED